MSFVRSMGGVDSRSVETGLIVDDSGTVDDGDSSFIAEKDLVRAKISVGTSGLDLKREERAVSESLRRRESKEAKFTFVTFDSFQLSLA